MGKYAKVDGLDFSPDRSPDLWSVGFDVVGSSGVLLERTGR